MRPVRKGLHEATVRAVDLNPKGGQEDRIRHGIGPVAQGIERPPPKRQVTGSNPVGVTTVRAGRVIVQGTRAYVPQGAAYSLSAGLASFEISAKQVMQANPIPTVIHNESPVPRPPSMRAKR